MLLQKVRKTEFVLKTEANVGVLENLNGLKWPLGGAIAGGKSKCAVYVKFWSQSQILRTLTAPGMFGPLWTDQFILQDSLVNLGRFEI